MLSEAFKTLLTAACEGRNLEELKVLAKPVLEEIDLQEKRAIAGRNLVTIILNPKAIMR